jgi:hypothetical protein
VQLFLTGNDSEYAYLFADTGPLPEGEWVTVEATFDPAEVADASSGLSSIGYAAGVVGPYDAEGDGFDGYDVSWVELVGAIPTRVYPRADGLGMGAPRIMDNRSPYTSPRVFGMI